ncbi:glycosyltransferase [Halobacteriovorax sp. ZH4_bin.1]|uniref:glycosyltransferase n=1 Tax=unclassified Halobacteriovorax TaxID=2639665 RepID=UPI00371A7F15
MKNNKIAVIGNTNNYPYMLALALAKYVDTVDLYYDSQDQLHNPMNYEDKPPSNLNVINITGINNPFLSFWIPTKKSKELSKALNKYDLILVNNLWFNFVKLRSNKKYFCLFTGSDIDIYSIPKKIFRLTQKNNRPFIGFIKGLILALCSLFQRYAIKNSIGYNYFPTGIIPEGDKILKEISEKTNIIKTCFMMTDCDRRIYIPPTNQNKKIVVIHTARHVWKDLNDDPSYTQLDNKRNDLLIKALKQYTDNYSKEIELIAFKKGKDWKETRDLAKKLNVDQYITWLDTVTQKRLFEMYYQSDIVADHFGPGSVVGMAGLDAMAMGRPLIAHARPEIFEKVTKTKSPICHASNEFEIYNHLVRLSKLDERIKTAEDSRNYVSKFFSSDSFAHSIIKL